MIRRAIAILMASGQGPRTCVPVFGWGTAYRERCGVAAPPVTESTTYVDTANAAASFHKAEFRGRALTHLFHQYAKKAGAQSFSQSLDLGLFRLPPV